MFANYNLKKIQNQKKKNLKNPDFQERWQIEHKQLVSPLPNPHFLHSKWFIVRLFVCPFLRRMPPNVWRMQRKQEQRGDNSN